MAYVFLQSEHSKGYPPRSVNMAELSYPRRDKIIKKRKVMRLCRDWTKEETVILHIDLDCVYLNEGGEQRMPYNTCTNESKRAYEMSFMTDSEAIKKMKTDIYVIKPPNNVVILVIDEARDLLVSLELAKL